MEPGGDMRARLQALCDLLHRYDPSIARRIDAVLEGSDQEVGAFLVSEELWGGMGSIVDQAGVSQPWEVRRKIHEAFIALGEWQMAHGYLNPRLPGWVGAFKDWRRFDPGAPAGEGRGPDGRRLVREFVPWRPRDVWFGVAAMAVIMGAAYGLALSLRALSVRPDLDLWVALVPTLFELLFLVPVWWFSIRKYRASPRALGFVGFKVSVLAAGLGLLVAFYFFNGAYAYLLSNFGLRVQTDITPLLRGLSSPWPLFVTGVLVAPLTEEVFFRGFVFGGLRGRYGWPWAAAISAALFAAAHLELTFFIPAFLLGYLFAYLYQRSGSIWPGMILHMLVNGVALAVVYSQI